MVKATSDQRTIMLLPATRSQVPPGPASCQNSRRALDARKRRASVFGSLPPTGRSQSKAATEKPLCAARGFVNGTLLVAMPVGDGREAEFGPASHQFSVSSKSEPAVFHRGRRPLDSPCKPNAARAQGKRSHQNA